MQTVKSKLKCIRNEHIESICKDTVFILSLKRPKNCRENWCPLDSYEILRTLENQEFINAVIKDEKYVKII